jgi:HAD superfamily hydrolase (TIGR01549 family)
MIKKYFKQEQFKHLPDAILFDTDNTLYPYEPAHAAAIKAVREKVVSTFSIEPKEFDKTFDQACQQVKTRLEGTSSSHSRLLYLQRMLEIMGLGSQVLWALDFEQTYWRTFLSNAILFDNVKELLDDLRLLGIPTAIVTDLTAQIQFRKVVYFGLDHYFDYVVTSEEAGFDKPHEAPFQIALEKMRPKGDCIWMIGDNPINDIRGARDKINAVTIQKIHHGIEVGTGLNTPDAVFNEYSDLRSLLTSLEKKMNSDNNILRTSVVEYCERIGTDPMLVQGAGGNISWKDNETLWVKASGTWLADAAIKDIFVPVDLPHLNIALEKGDFSVAPRLRSESELRPSIETLLHGLIPHRVVVHLHAIEILSYLVRDNFQASFQTIFDDTIHWRVVEYYKPGADLASAVSDALLQEPDINVIFLKNHGVVIGGENIAEVNHILNELTTVLFTKSRFISGTSLPIMSLDESIQYVPVQDSNVQKLAFNIELFNRLDSDWALYPDHVVFLGAKAFTYRGREYFQKEIKLRHEQPELVFIFGEGVFVVPNFNKSQYAQLLCYYEVLSRQENGNRLNSLSSVQVAEILNWDAEKFRQNNQL